MKHIAIALLLVCNTQQVQIRQQKPEQELAQVETDTPVAEVAATSLIVDTNIDGIDEETEQDTTSTTNTTSAALPNLNLAQITEKDDNIGDETSCEKTKKCAPKAIEVIAAPEVITEVVDTSNIDSEFLESMKKINTPIIETIATPEEVNPETVVVDETSDIPDELKEGNSAAFSFGRNQRQQP